MAHELRLSRRIAASPDEVYDAWTDAQQLQEWMVPFEGCRSVAQLDARVGGKFHIDMHGTEQVHAHDGEYLRLERPRLIEFTWVSNGTQQQRSVVTVELAPAGKGTELTLTHRLLPTEIAVDQHRGGWTAGLDHLVRYFPRARSAVA